MDDRSDERLLAALPRDPAALEAFYRRHVGTVTRFLARRCRTPEDLADAVAETFVQAISAAPRFDASRGGAAAWLLGVAANCASTQARARRRGLAVASAVSGRRLLDDDDYERLERQIDAARLAPALAAALDSLGGPRPGVARARRPGRTRARRGSTGRRRAACGRTHAPEPGAPPPARRARGGRRPAPPGDGGDSVTELGHFEVASARRAEATRARAGAPCPRARRWPRAAVLAAALAGLAAAGAGAAALTHALRADPHKAGLARTLDAGGHVGPRVAASGRFTLYASSDGLDAEVDYSESPGNGWSAATRLPARAPIVARALGDEPPNAVYGRVAIAAAARRRAALRRRAGRAGPARHERLLRLGGSGERGPGRSRRWSSATRRAPRSRAGALSR